MSSTAGGESTQTGDSPGRSALGLHAPAWSSRSSAGTTTPTTSCGSRSRTPSTPTWSTVTTATSWTPCMLWWRDDDGDLVDGLVDALTDLVGGGAIWLLTPKVGRPGAVDAADIAEAAPIAGPRRRPRRRPVSKDWSATRLVAPKTARVTAPTRLLRPRSAKCRRATYAGVATTAAVLAELGVIRPYSPADPGRAGHDAARGWGTGPAGGFARWRCAGPTRSGSIDELGPLTFGEIAPAQQRAGPRARRARGRRGRRGRGDVPQPPRLRRRHRRRRQARRRHALPQHRLRRPAAGRRARARAARAWSIHDEEFTGLLAGADVDAPGAGLDRRRRPPTGLDDPRVADRRRTPTTTSTPPDAPRPDRDPDLGHHRHAQGRPAQRGRHRRRRRRCSRGCRCATAGAPTSPRRCSTPGASPTSRSAMLLGSTVVLRRRFDPEDVPRAVAEDERCESLVVIPVMLQRILALPDEVLDAHDLTAVEVVAASGSALPGDLAADVDGPVRRQPLQHLRLDRGRLRLDRHARGPARGARPRPGRPPYGTVVKILDDDGEPGCRTGSPGRIFVGNSAALRGLHRRRPQGDRSTG